MEARHLVRDGCMSGKEMMYGKVEVAPCKRRGMMVLVKGDTCLDSGLFTCCGALQTVDVQ